MKHSYDRQLDQLAKKEQQFLARRPNQLIQETVSPMLQKLEAKIPQGLRATFSAAFSKGFQLVFERGTGVIEKTYDKERLRAEHGMNDYLLGHGPSRKNLRALDRRAKLSQAANQAITVAEGAGLGLLGIGLPDIPLFIAIILKSVYEIALSYGFGYESEGERVYILSLIQAAVTEGDARAEASRKADRVSSALERGAAVIERLPEEIRAAADALSDAMLTAKFIQGLPIVGVVGGVTNSVTLGRINRFAAIKYKMRYLQRKRRTEAEVHK